MPEISPLIRLFVSSTFADFTFEREVLQRTVFPRLRALCAAQGCRFQPIDLRWGVSEEASNEKRTLAICLDEIARCQRLSPDLNFLILLGDRYGSCFLPERIPSDQVARLLPHLAPAERDAFAQVYKEDFNALRPEHVLLPSDGAGDARKAEDPLRMALARAAQTAGFSKQEMPPFMASATHLEIQRGLLDVECDPSATICAIRSFESMPEGSLAAQYVEQDPGRRVQLEALKAAVEQRLRGRVWRYSAPGRIVGPRMGQAARARYKALAEQFYALLEPRIQEALARRQAASQSRDPGAVANRQFAASRALVVVGREEALDTVATYLDGQTPLPLIVTGESGVGKSTLLARAVEDAVHMHPSAVILTRYVGVTPGTSSLVDLLSGLRREIAERYNQPTPEPLGELSQLVGAFALQLAARDTPAERPLVLIIDALDQLSAQPQRIDWLPQTLAPHVRVVLSTLSDRQELANLRTWLPENQVLRLERLTRAQGADALHTWLMAAGRSVTSEQDKVVLDGFAPAPGGRGTPLYLRLAFEQARTWRSFDHVSPLPPTASEMIQTYLSELEEAGRHGRELVAYALGDIAAAKHGLAEDELLDVLSRSGVLREALQKQSPGSPLIKAHRPLPMALWARLASDLDRYLTEREVDGARLVTFYHQQVADETARRYLSGTDGEAHHADLAAYFDRQSYYISNGALWLWNQRKLAELAYHQSVAGSSARAELKRTLTDARELEGKLTVEGVAGALDDLALMSDDNEIAIIAGAVRVSAFVLAKSPSEVRNQIIGRVGDRVTLHDLPEREGPWIQLRSLSLIPPDPHLRHVLSGYGDGALGCALSGDGTRVLSAERAGTLRLWDTESGKLLRILSGHNRHVSTCALTADGRIALSGGNAEARVWDTVTGETMHVLKGHHNTINDCALSADGRLALTASLDYTLRLWDTSTGKELHLLAGHTEWVLKCALSRDGRIALSASGDQTLRLWDVATGSVLRIVEAEGWVHACALSADGAHALSSCQDEIRMWNTTTGETERIFRGHTSQVSHCVFSKDGAYVLSAAHDNTLRLWETSSGEAPRTFQGHTYSLNVCALSDDGRLAASSSGDDTIRIWDICIELSSEPASASDPSRMLDECALNAFGDIALCDMHDEATTWTWDTRTGRTRHVLDQRETALALSADGYLALTSTGEALHLWDTNNGRVCCKLQGHEGGVTDGTLSADGRLALSASKDHTLRLWDTDSGQTLTILKGHADVVWYCALSADGRLALSASEDKTLRVWDAVSGRTLHVLDGHSRHVNGITGCALSADGRIALSVCSGLSDRFMEVWDTTSGRLLFRFTRVEAPPRGCVLSTSGQFAFATLEHGRTLLIWDTTDGRELTRWTHDADFWCYALSGTSKVALVGDMAGGIHTLDLIGLDDLRDTPYEMNMPVSWLAERERKKNSLLRRLLGKA